MAVTAMTEQTERLRPTKPRIVSNRRAAKLAKRDDIAVWWESECQRYVWAVEWMPLPKGPGQ